MNLMMATDTSSHPFSSPFLGALWDHLFSDIHIRPPVLLSSKHIFVKCIYVCLCIYIRKQRNRSCLWTLWLCNACSVVLPSPTWPSLSLSLSISLSLSSLSLSSLSLFLVHSYLTARIHLDAELAHANYRTRLFTFLPAFLRLAFVLCDDRNARELLRPVFKIYGINMELASVDRGKSKE